MQIETWIKIRCPSCKIANWVCQGDLEDLTVPDVTGVQCHGCNTKFKLVDDDFMEEDDYYYVTGKVHPS